MPGEQTTFGKYTLLDRIDVGGMAEVFLAKWAGAEGFERTIAIKRILPHMAEDEGFVRMFIDEAKIASSLTHPNIAQIFDLGRADDHLFIALEYIHGKDLRAIWKLHHDHDRIMPLALSCHCALKVAEALHYAHFAEGPGGRPLGLIHRDVSPQNVLVSYEGEVKVIDFGLAKAAGRSSQTQAGVVKGKLAYMSPEQAHGATIDLRSDVYALGIVLWELLAGERLFFSANDVETILRVQRGDVFSPRRHNPAIPEDLERVVGLALQRDVSERYQTAMELHDDLQAFVHSAGLRLSADTVGDYLRKAFPVRQADEPITVEDAIPPDPPTLEVELQDDDTTTLIAPPRARDDDGDDL